MHEGQRAMQAWLVAIAASAGCFSDPPPADDGSGSEGGTHGTSGTAGPGSTAEAGTTNGDGASTGGADDGMDVGTDDATSADATGPGDGMTATTGPATCDPEACATGHCVGPDTCARFVFVTRLAYPSDFGASVDGGGIDGPCQTEAEEASLDAKFAAFVRDAEVDAFQRADIDAIPDAAFVLPGDEPIVVASSPAQLHFDGEQIVLEHPIDHDAFGNPVVGRGQSTACNNATDRVWTGYRNDSDGVPPLVEESGTCGSWTGANNGGTGRFEASNANWAGTANCPCVSGGGTPELAHLYCVEQL